MIISTLNLLFFADDGWVVGDSTRMLTTMLTELISTLRSVGLTVEPSDCRWMCTAADSSRHQVKVLDAVVPRVSQAAGLKMLGAIQTMSASSSVALEARLSATFSFCGERKALLHNPTTARSTRIRATHFMTQSVLVWGAESFTLTGADRARADVAQRKLLRAVARIPRRPEEPPREYKHRGPMVSSCRMLDMRHGHNFWMLRNFCLRAMRCDTCGLSSGRNFLPWWLR